MGTDRAPPDVVVTLGPGRVVLLAVILTIVNGSLQPLDFVRLVGHPHGVAVISLSELNLGVRG